MGWMMPFGGGMLKNASDLARIIWNLIKLGYADTVYSEEEKEIVNYLVDKWDISVEVYQEMIDIADTILGKKANFVFPFNSSEPLTTELDDYKKDGKQEDNP